MTESTAPSTSTTMTTTSSSTADGIPTVRTAVTHDRFGEPAEVLRVVDDAPVPTPAAGEVLLRVHAAGVDRGVWHLVHGKPYLARLAVGLRRPRQRVAGLDVAGTVVAVGDGVDAFSPGDEVFGIAAGAYATHAIARADKVVARPANLSPAEAAVVAISGLTALQAVRDQVTVSPGERVLITGASGGVGSFAVQLAAAAGAEVVAVCSAAKAPAVGAWGATRVIDYRADDAEAAIDAAGSYDAIIDIAGNRSLRRLRRTLTRHGRLVIVGGENGGRWTGGVGRQARALAWSPFVSQRLGAFISGENAADIAVLADRLAEGAIVSPLDRTMPLADAAAAIDAIAAGAVTGKLALVVDDAAAGASGHPHDET